MARKRGTTTGIGLGHEHQQEREAALARLVDGDPCPLCGLAMTRRQKLDLDHPTPRALGGVAGSGRLTHASCNRSAGARLGNRMRGAARKGVQRGLSAPQTAVQGLRHPDLPSGHPANHKAAHPNTSRQAHLPIRQRTDLPQW